MGEGQRQAEPRREVLPQAARGQRCSSHSPKQGRKVSECVPVRAKRGWGSTQLSKAYQGSGLPPTPLALTSFRMASSKRSTWTPGPRPWRFS